MTMQYDDLMSYCGGRQITCHSYLWSQPFYLGTFMLLLKDWGKEQIPCPVLHRDVDATKLTGMHSLWHCTQKQTITLENSFCKKVYFGKELFWSAFLSKQSLLMRLLPCSNTLVLIGSNFLAADQAMFCKKALYIPLYGGWCWRGTFITK